MKQIKDFSTFESSQKLNESDNSLADLRKFFPGLLPELRGAMKYTKQRGIDYEIEVGEDNGKYFPRIVIKGLEHPLDIKGYSTEGGEANKNELVDSIKKFATDNNLKYKDITHYGFWANYPVEFIKAFFYDITSQLQDRIFQAEEDSVNYKDLPIYKALIKAGFRDLTDAAAEKRKSIIFSHPFLIDSIQKDDKVYQGKIALSVKGPIRYYGVSSTPAIVKGGKPLTSKDNYIFSLEQAADILMLKVMKSIGLNNEAISQFKKMDRMEALKKFKDFIGNSVNDDFIVDVYKDSNIFKKEDFNEVLTPEQRENARLRSRVGNILI